MSEIPWCEIHHIQFELFQGQTDDDPEYYDCPECKREDVEALYGDAYKGAAS